MKTIMKLAFAVLCVVVCSQVIYAATDKDGKLEKVVHQLKKRGGLLGGRSWHQTSPGNGNGGHQHGGGNGNGNGGPKPGSGSGGPQAGSGNGGNKPGNGNGGPQPGSGSGGPQPGSGGGGTCTGQKNTCGLGDVLVNILGCDCSEGLVSSLTGALDLQGLLCSLIDVLLDPLNELTDEL